jgi:hypothetical protein
MTKLVESCYCILGWTYQALGGSSLRRSGTSWLTKTVGLNISVPY